MLIAVRALLGVAGATLMPSAMALVSTLFRDPKQMATAYGIFAGTFTLGAVFGPVIGGFMLGHFWWGSVFLIGVPIMVLLLIIGPKLLPEAKNPNAGRIDLTSVALWLLAVLPVIYGIKQLARYGWQIFPVVSLVLGLAFGWTFVRRQRTLEHPLLDLKLLRDRTIGVCLTGAVFNTMIGGGFMLTMMLYFQLVVGLSTLQAGLAMMPALLIGTLGFQIAPKLASRYKPAYVIAGGLVISAAAMAVMTQFNPDAGATPLIIGFAVMGFFGAPMPGLGTNLILASAPPERAGSAGSLAQLGNEFGNVLGFAIYGTIGAAVYRATLVLPSNTPPAVAAAAHDSLAGAAAATAHLPHDVAAAILAPAHQAFANGLHVVTGTATVVLLALAVLVATKLRHVQPFGHPAAAPVQ
jgi:DHA2 family multidrug resistance protein-like MFS transporter